MTKMMGWAHCQIAFFIISFQFTSKDTVIAGLIVWLTIVSTSLGLLEVEKLKTVKNV
jgi:hypothetical protein